MYVLIIEKLLKIYRRKTVKITIFYNKTKLLSSELSNLSADVGFLAVAAVAVTVVDLVLLARVALGVRRTVARGAAVRAPANARTHAHV